MKSFSDQLSQTIEHAIELEAPIFDERINAEQSAVFGIRATESGAADDMELE